MLGTNDIKLQFDLSAEHIIAGMHKLIQFVKQSHFGPYFSAPNILLIAPAPIMLVGNELMQQFYNNDSVEKSKAIQTHYAALAKKENCAFLDANPYVKISPVDGVHMDSASQLTLAKAVAEKIKYPA